MPVNGRCHSRGYRIYHSSGNEAGLPKCTMGYVSFGLPPNFQKPGQRNGSAIVTHSGENSPVSTAYSSILRLPGCHNQFQEPKLDARFDNRQPSSSLEPSEPRPHQIQDPLMFRPLRVTPVEFLILQTLTPPQTQYAPDFGSS